MMAIDRANRAVFAILGLLLLAAGIGGTLAGTGGLGHNLARRPLTDNPVTEYIGRHGSWFWPVVLLLALLITVLAARWLAAALLPAPRAGSIRLPGAGPDRTTLASNALTGVVNAGIASYPGVHAVDTDVNGTPAEPHLAITVRLDRDADAAAVRQRIEAEALAHAREALDLPRLPIRLDLTVTNSRGARVV